MFVFGVNGPVGTVTSGRCFGHENESKDEKKIRIKPIPMTLTKINRRKTEDLDDLSRMAAIYVATREKKNSMEAPHVGRCQHFELIASLREKEMKEKLIK